MSGASSYVFHSRARTRSYVFNGGACTLANFSDRVSRARAYVLDGGSCALTYLANGVSSASTYILDGRSRAFADLADRMARDPAWRDATIRIAAAPEPADISV